MYGFGFKSKKRRKKVFSYFYYFCFYCCDNFNEYCELYCIIDRFIYF